MASDDKYKSRELSGNLMLKLDKIKNNYKSNTQLTDGRTQGRKSIGGMGLIEAAGSSTLSARAGSKSPSLANNIGASGQPTATSGF